MNLNLIPNVEPADKFVKYFVESIGRPYDVSEKYISVVGGIATLDLIKKKSPKLPIVLVSEPEAAANQAKKTLDNDKSEFSVADLKAAAVGSKRHKSSKRAKDNTKKIKSVSKFTDVFQTNPKYPKNP